MKFRVVENYLESKRMFGSNIRILVNFGMKIKGKLKNKSEIIQGNFWAINIKNRRRREIKFKGEM